MYDLEGEKKFRVLTVGQEAEKKYIAKIKMQEAPGWEIAIDGNSFVTIIIRNKIPSNPVNLVYFCLMETPPLENFAYYKRIWQFTRNVENGVLRHFVFDEVKKIDSRVYRCLSGKKVFYVVVVK